jgi:hypothetical protein
MSRIRKTKPEVVAEIDALLNEHCDREVAEILNRHPHYGYGYEIIRPEDLPMLAPALKQWHEERKELRAAHAAKQGVAA